MEPNQEAIDYCIEIMSRNLRKSLRNKIADKYGKNQEYYRAILLDDEELIELCKILNVK